MQRLPQLPLTDPQRDLVTAWLAQWSAVKIVRGRFPGLYGMALSVGMDEGDITQAAHLGVCQASRRFDATRGDASSFATYAEYWVRAAVGHEVSRWLELGCRGVAKSRAPRPMFVRPDLEDFSCDHHTPMWETIPDWRSLDEDDVVESGRLAERFLALVDEKHRRVVRERIGFDGDEQTFSQIGQSLGRCRETARLTYNRAIRTMRQVSGRVAEMV